MSSQDSISAEVEAMRRAILAGEPTPADIERRERVQAKLPPEQRRNVSPPKPRVRPSRARTDGVNLRGANLRDRPPVVSRNAVRAAHAEGLMVADIARKVGCHRATARVILDELGLEPNPTQYGPKRKELCPAGLHDMAVHGRESSNKGRYCRVCKTTREREKREREREAARQQSSSR